MKKSLGFAIAIMPAVLSAQDPAAPALPKWTYSAKVTAVWVGGNSESSTFGLGSSLRRTGRLVDVNIEAGAIRTDASKKTHRAVGTPTSFRIEEEESSEKTAESYFVRARGDRKIG